jgi:hypothetical protein
MLSELIRTYVNLYQISLFITMIALWILLSYVDRIHMRERFRQYGKKLTRLISILLINEKTYDRFRLIVIRPMCAISEMITGFLEGIEGLEPIIMIASNKDNFIREENSITPNVSNPIDVSVKNEINKDEIKNEINKDEIKNEINKNDDIDIRPINDVFHVITTRNKKLNVKELIENQLSTKTNLSTHEEVTLKPLPRRGFNLSGLPMVRASIQSSPQSLPQLVQVNSNNTHTDTTSQDLLSKLPDVAKVVEEMSSDIESDKYQNKNSPLDETNSEKDIELNFKEDVDIKKVDEIIETFTTRKDNTPNNDVGDDMSESDKDDKEKKNDKDDDHLPEKVNTIEEESNSLSTENSPQIDIESTEPIKRRKIPIKLARFRQRN